MHAMTKAEHRRRLAIGFRAFHMSSQNFKVHVVLEPLRRTEVTSNALSIASLASSTQSFDGWWDKVGGFFDRMIELVAKFSTEKLDIWRMD